MIEHKKLPLSFLENSGVSTKSEGLCFDKQEFMKANFSIDEFLHKNRNAPSLEQLRDNLGIYLKGLRASMIDLINEDYADFVSLSANLVGLDQSIGTIQKPLEQFREEIGSIKVFINENEAEIRAHLDQKNQLRELKRNLQSLKKVYDSLEKLNKLTEHHLSDQVHAVDLERAALELIHLKFNERFCGEYLSQKQKADIVKLNDDVLKKLRHFFNEALKAATSTCSENLERALRIYVTLDACAVAESVFKDDFVAPYMSATISENALQYSHQGLAGIYSKILDFISLHMTDLLRLTHYTDKIVGLNFLLNSFWVDVEMRLETHMASIFAPGNSDIFHAKYKCTRDFMSKIEELLANEKAIRAFREHKQTRSFQARWNLPVYFQICFQEIAGKFENALEPVLHENIVDRSSNVSKNKFQFRPFNIAHKSIDRCWEEGVFLIEVFPKFYKLTLQIILRLARWIKDAINLISENKSSMEPITKLDKAHLLTTLHNDISKFISHMTETENMILTTVSAAMSEVTIIAGTLDKSFANLESKFSDHLRTIQTALINILIRESATENIRQVNDLPRLYRKTNRDIPSRSSLYIDQMLRPLKAFAEQETTRLGDEVVKEILLQVFSRITTDYYLAVADVLTSVQKTEESLRRLRNLKSGAAVSPVTTPSKAITDDDKIRLQLRVDVIAWTSELAKLNFMPTQIEKLVELNSIAEESIKAKDLKN